MVPLISQWTESTFLTVTQGSDDLLQKISGTITAAAEV